MKTKLINNSFYIIIGLLFIKMLLLNFLTPLMADDFNMGQTPTVIAAIKREYNHYFAWGGRSIVNALTRIVLIPPKIIYDVLNSFVYLALIMLIYKLANPVKRRVSVLLFIIASAWLFTIDYGQVVFWVTGAVIYMWGLVIILCFLLPYSIYLSGRNIFYQHKIMAAAGMLILGVLAGWGMENTSGGMIMLTILFLIYCKLFSRPFKAWMFSGLVGSIIGFMLLIMAPGNKERGQMFVDERSRFTILAGNINTYTNIIKDELIYLVLIFIILITIMIVTKMDKRRIYIASSFFISALAIIYVMIFSPLTDVGRTMFGATVFMIIACSTCLAGFTFGTERQKIAMYSFVAILSFYLMTTFVNGLHDIMKMRSNYQSRDKYITEQINEGNRDIVLPFEMVYLPRTKWNANYGLSDFGEDETHWLNYTYAQEYGLNSIIMITSNNDNK